MTVIGSKYDYLAPGYITLYITNMGEHSPSYIYRLFNEVYWKNIWYNYYYDLICTIYYIYKLL